jgi:exopolyphosphatase/guanosine-5'-triphosphate,3'-diphosphate pyrophosphatase
LGGEIIPRWEWRTFAKDLEKEGAELLSHGEPRVKDSKEVYILSRKSNENVKIRDGLMDVKSLQAVNEDGLEQWRPIISRTSTRILSEILTGILTGCSSGY